MSWLLDVPLSVFIGLTVVLFGGASFLTGQAIANRWRSVWHVPMYTALLGLGDRFLCYALFNGPLLTLSGYLIHTIILLAFCWAAYRSTLARNMVVQYPWLYERNGLFGWRQINP